LHIEGCVFELTPSDPLSECKLQLSKWFWLYKEMQREFRAVVCIQISPWGRVSRLSS